MTCCNDPRIWHQECGTLKRIQDIGVSGKWGGTGAVISVICAKYVVVIVAPVGG